MYLFTYYDGDCKLNATNNHTTNKFVILRLTWKQNQKLSYQGNSTRRLPLGVHYIDYIIKT